MVYQVLARKWRPSDFSEVVGQKETVTILQNSLNSNRLHHAYLFTGTRGIGKTTIARLFAKALICEQGISANPCNNCEICIAVNHGNCVDVIEVDAASKTKVEDTRAILDNLAYAPSIGRFKIYIIDEVHMLSNHSFNALLKSLEEPPSHIKFLLATTDPQKIPITVLSRCLEFKLKVFSPQVIDEQLKKILSIENKLFEDSAILQIAVAANGSMRDALSLLERVLAFRDNPAEIQLSDVCKVIGIPDLSKIINLLITIIQSNPKQAMEIVNDLFANNCDLFAVLQRIQILLKNITLLQLIPDLPINDLINKGMVVNKDLLDLLFKLASTIPMSDIQLYYEIAMTGFKNLAFVPDLQVGFEMIILRMLAFKSMPNAVFKDDSISLLENLKEEQVVDIVKSDPNHDKSIDLKEFNDLKESNIKKSSLNNQPDLYSIINQLNLSRLTKELAENSVFEFINYDLLHKAANNKDADNQNVNQDSFNQIKLIVDNSKKILVTKNNLKNLELAFSQYFNTNIKIKIDTVSFEQFPDLAQKTIKFQNEKVKQNIIEKDISLQQLVTNFNAEIQEITRDN